jgi:hypothetical protein
MKKARNGSIKHLRYLCLVGIVVLGLLSLIGSNGGGDGGDMVSDEPSGSNGGGDGGDMVSDEPLAPVAGNWNGSPGDLTIDFVVASNGNGLEEIKINFNDFSCGGSKLNGSITFSSTPPFPISNSSFEEDFVLDPVHSQETITIEGTFDSSGEFASGTYEAVFYGETCTGTWDASPL